LPPPIDAAQLDTLFESAEGDYGTVIYDVDNQTRLYEVDADRRFQTNSLIRLPIAVTAYALAGDEQGEFTLDNEVKLEQADIVDGPGTIQNDPPGTAYTVRDLCRRMIAESDDTAAAMLIRSIGGFDRVNAQMQALGATETKMHGFITERENQTIPDDMVLLLQKLAGGDIASGEEIVRAMEQSQSDDRIRTGLPPASNVASITSTFEGGVHRVMLIETPTAHRFILVVLSKDVPDTETFTETIAEAAALVFMSGGPPGHTSAPPTSQPQNGGEDTPDDPSAPSVPPDGGGVPDAPSAPPAPPDGTPEGPGVRPTPPDGMPLPPDGAPPPNGPPPNGPPPDGPPPPNGAPPRPDSP
jgi:beta-lactamase class A